MNNGFDFRNTSAYVTDPTNSQFVGNGTLYPHTSGGVTFGWQTGPQARDRSTSVDARLAGVNQVANNATTNDFIVDLGAAGSYTITIALGDASFAQTQYMQVYDGSTLLLTIPLTATAAGSFLDAAGVSHTAATFFANQTPATLTFAGTQARFRFGGTANTANSTISHIFITTATGGTTYNDTISESLSGSDNQSASAILASPLSETTTSSENYVTTALWSSQLSESVSSADVYASAAIFSNFLVENVLSADVEDSSATFQTTIAESTTTGDNNAVAATFPSTISENVAANDNVSGGLLLIASVVELFGAQDVYDLTAVYDVILDETLSSTDFISGSSIFGASFIESLVASDRFSAPSGPSIEENICITIALPDPMTVNLCDSRILTILDRQNEAVLPSRRAVGGQC